MNSMNTFMIMTLGCKVNQFESEAMAGLLTAAGLKQVTDGPADLYIVNTCAVTGKSAGQSRQYLRHCRRENPGAVVIATGCYATVAGKEIQDMACVDAIVTHAAKYKIPDMAARSRLSSAAGLPRFVDGGNAGDMFSRFSVVPLDGSRARPALKIQDGCNAGCTYCIVPHARGGSVSMPMEGVLSAVRQFAAAGYPEVVLTGIHLGAYGLDLTPPRSLYQLLVMIDKTAAIDRVRLSSVEPRELSDDIVELASRSQRICGHFHLPLQSGSDTILKRMARPYTASFFSDRVKRIKAAMPEAAVGVDVLVGFPGEGDREFADTLSLLGSLPVSYLHVFPFSPRPGTPAAGFAGQVPSSVIRERCRLLRRLGSACREQFCSRQKGRTETVRIEAKRDKLTGSLKGVTSNYLTVLVEGSDSVKDTNVHVRVGSPIGGLRVRAEII